jgi:hypothetical protein
MFQVFRPYILLDSRAVGFVSSPRVKQHTETCSLNQQNINTLEGSMDHDFAPAIVSVAFFLTIAAVWGAFLFTRHRERMAIIEKGLAPEEIRSLYKRERTSAYPLASLKWGLVLAFVGLAAGIGAFLSNLGAFPDGVVIAIACCAGGIGLIVFYLIARKQVA